MAYTPNPVDITEPVITRPAGSAAEEFRKLKEYIQTLVVSAGKSTGVRQTVLQGVTDSNGYAAFLAAGTGFTVRLLATARAVVFAFAAGYNATVGAVDSYAQLTTDTDPVVSGLAANNTSYLSVDYVSVSSVTWGKYLVPPDYSYAFDRSRGALLNFEGIDGSTTMVDDFGNTWAASGNAQIDTAQFKFGSSSLLLDGTGDFVESTNFTSLGTDSWELSIWFRLNATSANHCLISASNTGPFGVNLYVDHNGGSRRLKLDLSSNGTTNDILVATSTVTNIALATWHKARVVFDALAGTYRAYLSVNGAAETQEITQSSTARICAITGIRLGQTRNAANDFNGWIDAFRFVRAATATAVETPTAVAPAITDYPYHWFSIPEMKMYEVDVASSSAGVNPGMTAKNRVFVGEADTSGAAVTTVRSYALQGKFVGPRTTPLISANSFASNTHSIGVVPQNAKLIVRCITTDNGFSAGHEILQPYLTRVTATNIAGALTMYANRSLVQFSISDETRVVPAAGGAPTPLDINKWAYQMIVERGW